MKYWLCAILGLLVLASAVFGEEIPLPEGAVARVMVGWVEDVKFSPDGEYLAIGVSGRAELRNAVTLELIKVFEPSSSVECIALSPSLELLAIGTLKGTIEVYSTITGEHIWSQKAHNWVVNSLSFSPDGQLLASGSGDRTVKLWDTETGECVHILKGHKSYVNSVAFSPNGTLLASGASDKTIKLWEVATGRELRTLRGHTGYVSAIAFSPDGKLLASGSRHYDGTVKLWDILTGKCLRTLSGHTGWVESVAFAPDGRFLASGAWDRTVKLWEVTTGRELFTFRGHTDQVWAVSFSPNGKLLASGSIDGTVILWDVETILHPNKPPVAKLRLATLRTLKSTKPVEFDASDSHDPDGRITKYEWDWESDGTFDLTTTAFVGSSLPMIWGMSSGRGVEKAPFCALNSNTGAFPSFGLTQSLVGSALS